jgi:hypothetical protein
MSWGEKTREDARDAGPDPGSEGVPPPDRPAPADVEVPAMIRVAIEKHRRDLPELMERCAYRWAAYRGEERLEIGASKRELYRKYLGRGLSPEELVVLGIGPEIPDDVGGDELLNF